MAFICFPFSNADVKRTVYGWVKLGEQRHGFSSNSYNKTLSQVANFHLF